jgi:hypothetical protein
MSELDFFRSKPDYYLPITPQAAIRAYEEGILPIEQFIYMSTSLQPLDEKLIDISAIERVLARDDLGLAENLFLINIFDLMVNSKDSEYTVFAAESINLIEARYNSKIEFFKKEYERSKKPAGLAEIAELYYELGLLNENRFSIKEFYLKEAFTFLKDSVDVTAINKDDIKLFIKILLELGLNDFARDFLSTIDDIADPIIPVLRAKVEFSMHQYKDVHDIIKNIDPDMLGEDEADLYTYWLSPYEK